MHSDCVQIFGKYQINMKADNIDALSASAHKFYGPKGVGLLIISNALIEGYALTAEISGSQQHSLRGGTENIPGIASMLVALQYAFVKRRDKNIKLFALRNKLLESLAKIYEFDPYDKYLHGDVTEEEPCIKLVSLGPPSDKTNFILPNTILLHRKKESNTLYTINALNTLIKTLNKGVLDTKYIVNWHEYRNSILLTNGPDLRKLDTSIYKIIDFNK
jgi:hypothetical protein